MSVNDEQTRQRFRRRVDHNFKRGEVDHRALAKLQQGELWHLWEYPVNRTISEHLEPLRECAECYYHDKRCGVPRVNGHPRQGISCGYEALVSQPQTIDALKKVPQEGK
jgi:hypothetical protein